MAPKKRRAQSRPPFVKTVRFDGELLDGHALDSMIAECENEERLQRLRSAKQSLMTNYIDMLPAELRPLVLAQLLLHAERPVAYACVCTAWLSDWRDKQLLQQECGSCWAFSVVEQIESDWFLAGKTNKPEELSTQQVVDCDEDDQPGGCGGTYAGRSGYGWVEKNGGLASEKEYPYTSGKAGQAGKCKKGVPNAGGKISNYSFATKPCDLPWDDCNNQDEDAIVNYLGTRGPLAICVNARSWIHYKKGVLSAATCGGHDHGSLDHCVQVVGYQGTSHSPTISGESGLSMQSMCKPIQCCSVFSEYSTT